MVGGLAYVADLSWGPVSGVRVIDVSTPSSPSEVGFFDTPGWAFGVVVSGSYAYVEDGEDGLCLIDVSDSTDPLEVGFVDTPGGAASCRSWSTVWLSSN